MDQKQEKTVWEQRASDFMAGYIQATYRFQQHESEASSSGLVLHKRAVLADFTAYIDAGGVTEEREEALAAFHRVYALLALHYGGRSLN